MMAACLSTASFPQHLSPGVADEQVRFAVRLTPCDGVMVARLPRGISCQQGRLSVFLFSC